MRVEAPPSHRTKRGFALTLAALSTAVFIAAVGCSSSQDPAGARAPEAAPAEYPSQSYQQGTAGAAPTTTALPGTSQSAKTPDEAFAALDQAEKDLTASLDVSKPVPLSTDRCTVVCKALASMKNAATRVCELTTDSRCDDAKSRLAKAETKAKAACPACEGG